MPIENDWCFAEVTLTTKEGISIIRLLVLSIAGNNK